MGSYGSLTKLQKIIICSIGLMSVFCLAIGGIILFWDFFVIGLVFLILGAVGFIGTTITWIIFEFINKRS
ncbi:hypothetical protein SSABA_v1c08820 [Spiroplasma sabaudiense Ar-1343]|uniref:Transmembrane protein n=1 Tax=Spiroplasma sabaudiense Ar-1343 TaxID=1276257 RepID=W6ABB3_9MOLU|nr:hypothetical protein SSABA_v1c08820 [Spiroplasma sabaudiense Ar-1343]